MPRKPLNLVGQQFERLTVIERAGKDKCGQVLWLCKCECGKETIVRGADLRGGKSKSCGCLRDEVARQKAKQCKGEKHPMYGHKHSEERKQQQSEQMKGRYTGEKHPMYGKHHTEETKRKMSESHKNSNITDEERELRKEKRTTVYKEHKTWTYLVKEQANFTCDICRDNKGGNLVSHHLEDWHTHKELRYDVSNGVCLCEHCHKEFHSWMGGTKVPCTKEDYTRFKLNKQEEDAQLVASF